MNGPIELSDDDLEMVIGGTGPNVGRLHSGSQTNSDASDTGSAAIPVVEVPSQASNKGNEAGAKPSAGGDTIEHDFMTTVKTMWGDVSTRIQNTSNKPGMEIIKGTQPGHTNLFGR